MTLLDFIEKEIKISISEGHYERLDYLEQLKEIIENHVKINTKKPLHIE